jgi:hypothetical protein
MPRPRAGAARRHRNSDITYPARYNRGAVLPTYRRISLAAEKNYQAEYLGSGTFVIRKPKRKKHKTRQSRLRNPERGSRK